MPVVVCCKTPGEVCDSSGNLIRRYRLNRDRSMDASFVECFDGCGCLDSCFRVCSRLDSGNQQKQSGSRCCQGCANKASDKGSQWPDSLRPVLLGVAHRRHACSQRFRCRVTVTVQWQPFVESLIHVDEASVGITVGSGVHVCGNRWCTTESSVNHVSDSFSRATLFLDHL